MSVVSVSPAMLCLFVLSACASLGENECMHGDWEGIGFRDGQNGRPLARIDEHRDACHRFGVTPVRAAYIKGRERGLNFYCTPTSALYVGRRGEQYAGVCPAASERDFLRAYEAGRELYLARERLDEVDRERRMLETRIFNSSSVEEARALSLSLQRTEMERDFLWLDVRRREMRAIDSVRN